MIKYNKCIFFAINKKRVNSNIKKIYFFILKPKKNYNF